MSAISPKLVKQKKTLKCITDMAKLQIKSDNITPFGGLFPIFRLFERSGLRQTIDSCLGPRSADPRAFSYSDVFKSLFSSYLCGGDCLEDVADVKAFWDGHDRNRIAGPDTIARTLKALSCEDITYGSKAGAAYRFNTADRLNVLLLKGLKATGQLCAGDLVDLDFDHQFIPAEKKDAKWSYKKAMGYFPGVATVGGLIVGIENRDGNTNVRFRQKDTLERIISRLETITRCSVRNFRADCGSYSEAVVSYIKDHCEHFYIRASGCGSRLAEFMSHDGWRDVEIGGLECGVASFTTFMAGETFRLVVQRTKVSSGDPSVETVGLFGTEYVYRCIITNDIENFEECIIAYYNRRGTSERNFDCQNNDFGWAHLPFSFLGENTVFLIITAMLKNFYLYILLLLEKAGAAGIDTRCRIKRFVRRFLSVAAKWTRSARTEVLTLYTRQRVYFIL